MEEINKIRSIFNLTSVEPSPEIQSFVDQIRQHIHQQQQQHQQQQRRQQQQPQPIPPRQQVPSLIHQAASVTQHLPSPSNGSSNNNNHNHAKPQQRSRNSSLLATSTNGPTKSPIVNGGHSNGNHTIEKNLIDLITCKLCKGYLIDAITIDLCMHSFCRPCALVHMKDHHRCPECDLEIKDKRFLNRLKTDATLQSIVYKLVPGLYEKEMERRRKFYALRPTPTPRYKSEMFGDIPPAKTIKPEDSLNISLTWLRDVPDDDPIKTFLLCRADTTMLILKKLIIAKFGLERPIKIYYGISEILFDLTALMDIATMFSWSPENKVLALTFREHDDHVNGLDNNKQAQAAMTNFSNPTIPGHDP